MKKMHNNTPASMVTAIKEFLEERLANMRFPTKDTGERVPTVHEGYLPPKKNPKRGETIENEDYPFVIVRFLDEEDDLDNENDIFNFRIIAGTFNDDEQHGWKDITGLLTRIKFELKRKKFIGGGSLTGKIELGVFEEQMKPTWHGTMTVSFKMYQVQQEGVFNDELFEQNY